MGGQHVATMSCDHGAPNLDKAKGSASKEYDLPSDCHMTQMTTFLIERGSLPSSSLRGARKSINNSPAKKMWPHNPSRFLFLPRFAPDAWV